MPRTVERHQYASPFYTGVYKVHNLTLANDPTITRRHGGTTLAPLEVKPENPNTSNFRALRCLRNDTAKDTVDPKRCQPLPPDFAMTANVHLTHDR